MAKAFMKFIAWSFFCAFVFGAVAVFCREYFPNDSKFVRNVVLVPTSGEYDAIAISAQGTIPSGYDLATSAWVLITLNRDGNQERIVALLESIDDKKGVLTTSDDIEPKNIGNAFTLASYQVWFRSLGLDPSSPPQTSEVNALPRIVQNVARGSKSGVGADPALFRILLDETTYAWVMSQGSIWMWLPNALLSGLACTWFTGICFLAFKPRQLQTP